MEVIPFNYIIMNRIALVLLLAAAVAATSFVEHFTLNSHDFTEEISKELSSSIKIKLYYLDHVGFRISRKSPIILYQELSWKTSFRTRTTSVS